MGMKCRECGMQKGGTLFSLSLQRAVAASAAAIAFGAVAGFAADLIGWFALFVAVGYGTFAGEMVMRASGRKRGIRLELITAIGMALGAIGGRLIVAPTMPAPTAVAVPMAIPSVIGLAALVIAISAAVGRIRYL